MAIPKQPTRFIPRPFAESGTYQVIPDSGSGLGRASFEAGFPVETQRPLTEGGVAPNRLDFNGLFNLLTAFGFWQQSGGQWTYNATLNYAVPCIVFHGGKLWWCVAANGADTTVVTPGTDAAYWAELLPVLADQGGVKLGGSGYNTKTVLTASQTWRAPVDGTYKVTCIGGGGAGGRGANTYLGGQGGKQGGTTSFGSYVSAMGGSGGGGGGGIDANASGDRSPGEPCGGGGGGAGQVEYEYVTLAAGTLVTATVGAGAVRNTLVNATPLGTSGSGPYGGSGAGAGLAGAGAPGAGSGGYTAMERSGTYLNYPGLGGSGAITGLGFGGGGGGGVGGDDKQAFKGGAAADGAEFGGLNTPVGGGYSNGGYGGAGGNGAIILEYYRED